MRNGQPWKIVRCIAVIVTAVWTCAFASDNTALQWRNITIDGLKMTVHCIIPDKDGQLWLGTSYGLYHLSDNGVWHIGNDELGRSRVNAIIPTAEGLYLGTNAGLLSYSFSDNTLQQLTNSLGEIRALTLFGDTLWMGSNGGVYYCLLSHPVSVTNVSTGLPSSSVYCLLRDSRGALYAGTYNGLARWNSTMACFERQMPENTEAISSFVNTLIEYEDRQSLLVGIHESLYRYEPVAGRWTKIPLTETLCIKSLAATGEDVLIGRENGLYVLHGNDLTVYRHDGNDAQSIADNTIWSIATDDKGRIYAGHGRGLSVSGEGRNMYVIPLSDLLGRNESGEIHCMLRDSHGSLWLGGTNGIIQITNDKLPITNIRHFLPNVMIRALHEDSEGRLWLATDDGLKQYLPEKDDFITYYLSDAEGSHEALWVYSIVEDSVSFLIGSYLGGLHRIAKSRLNEGGKLVADRSYNTSNTPMPNDFVRTVVNMDGNVWVQYWETEQVTRIAADGTFATMESNAMPSQSVLPQGYFCAYYDELTHSTLLGGTDQVVEIGSDDLLSLIRQYRQVHSPFRSWWAITLYVLFALLILGNFIWFTYKKRHTEQKAQELDDALSHVKQRLTKTQDFIVPESTAEKQLVLIVKTVDENSGDSELNVNTLSAKTGIGAKQLYRILKKEMKMSPLEYINSVRLNKAAKMLAEHKFSVSEVCYRTGFSTPSYFAKCFQEKFGCKPSEY